jgi:hypothetical protein
MIEDKTRNTSIGQLGEFGLIDHLTKIWKYNNLLHLRALVMMQLFLILR